MSVSYYGDFPEDAMVYIPFNTFDSNDPTASVTITNLADTDVYYHKDGSTTDYSADAATLVTIDFDSITGNHMLAIDTSENVYFATGSEYSVRIEGTTVDGGTINAFIGSFSIERAGGVLATLKTLNIANGAIESDLTYIHGSALTETSGQLAGRFVNFFDQAAAGYSVANALADFKATGFAPAGEYDTELDANMSSRAPAAEYDTEMARITANVATEAKQDIIDTNVDTIVVDVAGLDGDAMRGTDSAFLASEGVKIPKSDSNVTWNATALASIEGEVDNGIDNALPGTPTAGSLGDYMKRAKFAVCNKFEVDEDDGDNRVYDDSGTLFNTTVAAFTSASTITKREKIL